jgi:plastocyanin
MTAFVLSRRRPGRLLALVVTGLSLLLAGTLATPGTAQADPSTTIELTIDQQVALVSGQVVGLDTAAIIDAKSSSTFVPVRFVGEALGAYVGWEGATQQVTYLTGDTRIELWVGKSTARVNGQEVSLPAAPFIDRNGRTLVPLRFVSERFGAKVTWDGAARKVTITAPWVGRVVLLEKAKFSAPHLQVAAGTRVTWVNLDLMVHDVVGPGFDSGTLARLQAFSHTFTKAGTYPYECTFHPGMTAQVTVQ